MAEEKWGCGAGIRWGLVVREQSEEKKDGWAEGGQVGRGKWSQDLTLSCILSVSQAGGSSISPLLSAQTCTAPYKG